MAKSVTQKVLVDSGRLTRKATPKPMLLKNQVARTTAFFSKEGYRAAFGIDAMERVAIVKHGVSAKVVGIIAGQMRVPKEKLAGTLGISRATIDRKVRKDELLSPDESSRVMGMARLVGQVQAMVEESGNAQGFDAALWLARWLEQPVAALGGRRPAELMDTPDGQGVVAQLVSRMQSGAFS